MLETRRVTVLKPFHWATSTRAPVTGYSTPTLTAGSTEKVAEANPEPVRGGVNTISAPFESMNPKVNSPPASSSSSWSGAVIKYRNLPSPLAICDKLP